jgi:hypothetical protein
MLTVLDAQVPEDGAGLRAALLYADSAPDPGRSLCQAVLGNGRDQRERC